MTTILKWTHHVKITRHSSNLEPIFTYIKQLALKTLKLTNMYQYKSEVSVLKALYIWWKISAKVAM